MQTSTSALKEWQVAIDALERGDLLLLLRKGGIREAGGQFQVEQERVLLYPTYEHQQPALLKEPYTAQVQPVASGWHPETVRIGSWADITEVIPIRDPESVEALFPFHIWNERFVTERLKWKPNQPLFILLLRVYRLPQVRQIPYRSAYGGCKSWIDLEEAMVLDDRSPVLSAADYADRVATVHRTSL